MVQSFVVSLDVQIQKKREVKTTIFIYSSNYICIENFLRRYLQNFVNLSPNKLIPLKLIHNRECKINNKIKNFKGTCPFQLFEFGHVQD